MQFRRSVDSEKVIRLWLRDKLPICARLIGRNRSTSPPFRAPRLNYRGLDSTRPLNDWSRVTLWKTASFEVFHIIDRNSGGTVTGRRSSLEASRHLVVLRSAVDESRLIRLVDVHHATRSGASHRGDGNHRG